MDCRRVYAPHMPMETPDIPLLRLMIWCIEDVVGPMTLLVICAGLWIQLRGRVSSCAYELGWASMAGIAAGEVARLVGLVIPGGVLLVMWGVAAATLARTGRAMGSDLRNQSIADGDERWAHWSLGAAAVFLGILFAGDFVLSLVAGRVIDVEMWTALTVGAGAMLGVWMLRHSDAKWARLARLPPHRASLVGMVFIVIGVLGPGLRAGLWFVASHEILGGAELDVRTGTAHLEGMRHLIGLRTANEPAKEIALIRQAATVLGRPALAAHLDSYALPGDSWPRLLAVGGRVLRGESELIGLRVEPYQRRVIALRRDGVLLRIGFHTGGQTDRSSVQVWEENLPRRASTVAMAIVPARPETRADYPTTVEAAAYSTGLEREPGQAAGLWDTVYVLASNGVLATVRENLTGNARIPMPNGRVCRDLAWLPGAGILVLLSDGTVLERASAEEGGEWRARWKAVPALSGTKVACGIAVRPDGSGAYVLDRFGGIHPQGDVPIRYHMLGEHRGTPHYFHPRQVATRMQLLDPRGNAVAYGDTYGGVHGIVWDGEKIVYAGTTHPMDNAGECRDLQIFPELNSVYVGRSDGNLLVFPGTRWLRKE